jgi:alkyl sulfatase BDS1-like metallo-beta-lactamase superfamily hydrolase
MATSMAARLRANCSLWVELRLNHRHGLFLILEHVWQVRTVKAVERLTVGRLVNRPCAAAEAGGAIDAQGAATDERRRRAEQENDGRADFRLGADALERYVFAQGRESPP